MEWKIFNNKCWWCGSSDLSEEHRYKRTDVEREFFSNSSKDKIILCNLSEITQKGKFIQGPKSKNVKFKPSLCQNCNNSKSQSFDKSYDKLIEFLKENEANTLRESSIKLNIIYGENYKMQIENLIKYFIKHLCCTLCEINISVPSNLIYFLNGESEVSSLELVISQSIDRQKHLEIISRKIPNSSWIGCSDVQVEYNKKTNVVNFVKYELYYRSYSFYLHLNPTIDRLKTNFDTDKLDLILYNEKYFADLNDKQT